MLRQENNLIPTSSTSILKKLQEVRPFLNEIDTLKKTLLIAAIVLQQFETVHADVSEKTFAEVYPNWWVAPVGFAGIVMTLTLCACILRMCPETHCSPSNNSVTPTQTDNEVAVEIKEKSPTEHEIIIPRAGYSISSSSSSDSESESSLEQEIEMAKVSTSSFRPNLTG